MQLDYPFGETLPATGKALAVAPGVYWIRMGLPFALNHINLWLLEDSYRGKQGWTIIDCGISDETTRAAGRKFSKMQKASCVVYLCCA